MRRDEYEERKRRLDEQLAAGIELLKSAHRQQVRALDLVWMTTAEEDVSLPPRAVPPAPVRAAAPAKPAPVRRRTAGQLRREVEAALAKVPDVFDRNDVCRALGYEPDRGSLHRELREMARAGRFAIHSLGSGKHPTRYKKTAARPPAADG